MSIQISLAHFWAIFSDFENSTVIKDFWIVACGYNEYLNWLFRPFLGLETAATCQRFISHMGDEFLCPFSQPHMEDFCLKRNCPTQNTG